MGHSLSADVFWGFDLGSDEELIDEDEMPLWWYDDEDWKEVLARKLGWNEVPYPPGGFARENYRSSPEYPAWSASRDELQNIAATATCEIHGYGYESGGSAVRVKASTQATDEGPARLTDLIVAPDWLEQITRFCELLELPIPDEGPGWHLTATWT